MHSKNLIAISVSALVWIVGTPAPSFAQAEGVDICHNIDEFSWKLLTFPVPAATKHSENHDDALPGGLTAQTQVRLDDMCRPLLCPCDFSPLLLNDFFANDAPCSVDLGLSVTIKADPADFTAPIKAVQTNGVQSLCHQLDDADIFLQLEQDLSIDEVEACLGDLRAQIERENIPTNCPQQP